VANAAGPSHGTECDDWVCALVVGVGCSEGQDMLDCGRPPEVLRVVGLDRFDRILRGDIAIEVEKLGFKLCGASPVKREPRTNKN
jgi:hypothetical protein